MELDDLRRHFVKYTRRKEYRPAPADVWGVGESSLSMFCLYITPVLSLGIPELKRLDEFLVAANHCYCESAMILIYGILLGRFPTLQDSQVVVLTEVMPKTGKSRLRAVSIFQKQPNSPMNPFLYVHYMCVKNRSRGYGLKLAQMMERHLWRLYGDGEVVGFQLTDGDDRSRKFYAEKVGMFLTKDTKYWTKLFTFPKLGSELTTANTVVPIFL